jgi:hypothetical protein
MQHGDAGKRANVRRLAAAKGRKLWLCHAARARQAHVETQDFLNGIENACVD